MLYLLGTNRLQTVSPALPQLQAVTVSQLGTLHYADIGQFFRNITTSSQQYATDMPHLQGRS